MHNEAHVRLRAQAPAATELTDARRARTGVAATRLTGPGQLVARWVPSANGCLEMRWVRRFAPPTLITHTRGEAAARRLDSGD
jgi:hypothetical protein